MTHAACGIERCRCDTEAFARLERALAQAQGEIQRWKANYKQLVDDMFDGFECVPECDKYGHAEHCPGTNSVVALRTLRAQVERLTAALTELANISRSECGACIEHQEIARAALTEPGGQP